MKTYSYRQVELTGGYWLEKEMLNRKITMQAVYDRFLETGRIGAFDFSWKPGDPQQPHIFYDSDVAKWMEGAAHILYRHPDPLLEERMESLIAKILAHQGADGYFNIFFTVVQPEGRFSDRDNHELYCAGHLMEAAVAYAEATGKEDFLHAMERYAEHIYRVFVQKDPSLPQAKFVTPGHEEIELALVRLYDYTKKPKYLELAEFFINSRGVAREPGTDEYNQSHLPVRQQTEAVGHAVRGLYLYCGMASLARAREDRALARACKVLWEDMVQRKMYITGSFGSTRIGEAFTAAYDLPMDTAYTETCAAIATVLLSNRMLALENDARYADVAERALYNGVLSGLSLDGRAFFYENPLEINLSEGFSNRWGRRELPITQRVPGFDCSCCPPNLNRLLSSLGNYIYGLEGDMLYVNQYAASRLEDGSIRAEQVTEYPREGAVSIQVQGVNKVALRIPGWCKGFTLNRPYTMERGYAVVENDGSLMELRLDMTPSAVYADPRVFRAEHRLAIMRGPVVYCAEGVDNGENLHGYAVAPDFDWTQEDGGSFGLPVLTVSAQRLQNLTGGLYSQEPPAREPARLRLIPYAGFANRGQSNMLVWLWQG